MTDLPAPVNPGGSLPGLVNQPVKNMETALDAVIRLAVEPALEAYIFAQVPELALPVLKQITETLVEKLVEREAAILKTFLAFSIIDSQVAQENKAVRDNLAAWQAAHDSGDAHAIEKATDDLANSFGHLIHYDGS